MNAPEGRPVFVERRINAKTNVVELWAVEWDKSGGMGAKKNFLHKIADENPLIEDDGSGKAPVKAICWSYGRTLGNIAMFSDTLMGSFPNEHGVDAELACDIVNAGKFRNGAERWWCRTHQTHWGLKADIAAYEQSGVLCCGNRSQLMNYVRTPFEINVDAVGEVGVWCSLPAALSSAGEVRPRPPRIHVHVRKTVGGKKDPDQDFHAISVRYSPKLGLFASNKITQVSITPPAAYEFLRGMVEGQPMDCVNCSNCGVPHLDLGSFAREPHRKHFCGNCGRDSTWSKEEICSTPLKPLHDQLMVNREIVRPDRKLNLDKYKGCHYAIWASTPAVLWTHHRPQEEGVHVHVTNGTERLEDDTFGEVILDGRVLDRAELLKRMMDKTVH